MQQIPIHSPLVLNNKGISYPIALNSSNKLVSAITASKEDEYTCFECGVKMVLCKGDIVRPYFRHTPGTGENRFCSSESYIHKVAKTLLKDKIQLSLDYQDEVLTIAGKCERCSEEYSIDIANCVDRVETEFLLCDRTVKPDLTLFKKGKAVIALEVVNTHYPEQSTLKTFEENSIGCFVIEVSEQDDLVTKWKDGWIEGKWHVSKDFFKSLLNIDSLTFGLSLEEKIDYLKENLDYFYALSTTYFLPWCSCCTQSKINENISFLTKTLLNEKREKEQREKTILLDQDRIRRWNSKDLILLQDKTNSKTLGLLTAIKHKKTAIDTCPDEYLIYIDIEEIKIKDGVLWIDGYKSTNDILKDIKEQEILLKDATIKSKNQTPYDFIKKNDENWCYQVNFLHRKRMA